MRHLNHGSFGAAPRPVLAAQAQWSSRVQNNPNRFFADDLDAALDVVRRRAAAFLRAQPEHLYLLANPTAAVLAALRSAAVGPGDRVLLTDAAYPGVRAAAEATGAEVVTWAVPEEDADAVQAFGEALDRPPRLAVVEHVAYASGRILPVADLVAAAHRAGTAICVDGAHAPGALDIQLEALGCDYYAGSFHKWCCAPPGAGFLHAAGPVRPPLPGARDKDGPHPAVEWAGTHDFTPLLAVPAALDLLEAIGLDRVRAYQAALTAHAADRCDASRPRGRHPGLLALPLSRRLGLTDREVRAAARAAGFEVAAPEVGGARHLRVSAHLYNHPGDYDALAAWLRA